MLNSHPPPFCLNLTRTIGFILSLILYGFFTLPARSLKLLTAISHWPDIGTNHVSSKCNKPNNKQNSIHTSLARRDQLSIYSHIVFNCHFQNWVSWLLLDSPPVFSHQYPQHHHGKGQQNATQRVLWAAVHPLTITAVTISQGALKHVLWIGIGCWPHITDMQS